MIRVFFCRVPGRGVRSRACVMLLRRLAAVGRAVDATLHVEFQKIEPSN